MTEDLMGALLISLESRRPWYDRTKTWTTRTGEVIALADLEPSHRRNILRWIAKRISVVREAEGWRWAFEVGAHDGGDMAHDALESELRRAEESHPLDFFNSLPLVKALKALEPTLIVRVASHRANEKLQRVVPLVERTELFSFNLRGSFVEIPIYRWPEILPITGITRAQKQDRSLYSPTWRSGRMSDREFQQIAAAFSVVQS